VLDLDVGEVLRELSMQREISVLKVERENKVSNSVEGEEVRERSVGGE
jgi:hypothetical protein